MHAKLWVLTVAVTATLMTGTPSAAVTVRTGFSETTIASGLAFPTTMEFAWDKEVQRCTQILMCAFMLAVIA